MKDIRGKNFTFAELLADNLDWLLQEYPEYSPEKTAEELVKMMADTHPLRFDTEEEEEQYNRTVDSLEYHVEDGIHTIFYNDETGSVSIGGALSAEDLVTMIRGGAEMKRLL